MPIIISGDTTSEVKNLTVTNTYPVTLRDGKLVQDDAVAALRAAGYAIIHINALPTDDFTAYRERS